MLRKYKKCDQSMTKKEQLMSKMGKKYDFRVTPKDPLFTTVYSFG